MRTDCGSQYCVLCLLSLTLEFRFLQMHVHSARLLGFLDQSLDATVRMRQSKATVKSIA